MTKKGVEDYLFHTARAPVTLIATTSSNSKAKPDRYDWNDEGMGSN